MRRIKSALTLIELVVVLLVLVALAGVLVPQFQNFSTRAHGAAGADNAVEISKAITLFEATKLQQPNNFCSLLTDAATPTTLSTLVPVAGTPQFAVADGGTGGNGRAINLFNAGIASLSNINDAAENATFGSETLANALATDGTAVNLVFLTTAGANALGLNPNPDNDGVDNDYVALGVGETCSMIGTAMVDAPIHFPEGADGQPDQVYARWFAIYRVSSDPDGKAVLVSVAGNDDGNLSGANGHLKEYFESTK